jgi:hypothetical protein
MYKLLTNYFSKRVTNFIMGLWYFLLVMLNIYCILSGAQGAFQYVGW